MKRREFLYATAATLSTGPLLLGMTRKAESKHPTIGIDGHRYECHHNWGTLPSTLEWQTTHNVAIDAAGQIYITHQGHKDMKGLDTVMVFDNKGQFIRSFGKEWHGGGHGIDVRKDGSEEFLYLTNTWTPKIKAAKTTLKGEMVWEMGRPECKEYENPKANYNPTNVAFCADGSFFIGDGYGSHYMLKYSKDGKLKKVFGGNGAENGKFKTPHGNWVDNRSGKETLVVCDRANARLQTFDLDGKHLSTTDKGTVLFPANIDTNKDVLLVPDLHSRVSLFDKQGNVIVHLGEQSSEDSAWRQKVVGSLGAKAPNRPIRTQPREWQAGRFVHPHDACFDHDGNIYVVEWVQGGRVTFLKKVG